MAIEETKRDYLEDTYKFTDEATILGIEKQEDGSYIIYLSNTIFHPQGGGQPYEPGDISNEKAIFHVNKVLSSKTKSGVIEHYGNFENETLFEIGDHVSLQIDEKARRLHARLHSSGHLLDQAVAAAGYNFPTSKGNHRPGESFVEYIGKIEAKEKEELLKKTQIECDRLVAEAIPTKINYVDPADTPHDTSFLKPGEKARIVCVAGDCDYPCSGTHVKNSSEIGKLVLTKVTCKKGIIRISYKVDD